MAGSQPWKGAFWLLQSKRRNPVCFWVWASGPSHALNLFRPSKILHLVCGPFLPAIDTDFILVLSVLLLMSCTSADVHKKVTSLFKSVGVLTRWQIFSGGWKAEKFYFKMSKVFLHWEGILRESQDEADSERCVDWEWTLASQRQNMISIPASTHTRHQPVRWWQGCDEHTKGAPSTMLSSQQLIGLCGCARSDNGSPLPCNCPSNLHVS